MRPILLTVLSLGIFGSVHADPAWRDKLSNPAPGPHPRLGPTTLQYKLSWNGILDAASLTFAFGRPDPTAPGSHKARAVGGSTGLAAKLFPYRLDFKTQLDPKSLRPRSFKGTVKDDEERITTAVTFGPNEITTRETTRVLKLGRDFKRDYSFKFSPVFDIFSAMLWVRSQPLAAGDKLSFVISPGKKPYLVDVTAEARERLANRDCIRLRVGMRRIGKDLELENYTKLTSAHLWLSDDNDRIPVELRCKVFVGDVRMSLQSISRN